ncbi:MAG: zinc ribbon domain-containing protein [Nitrospirota bacterium]
MPIYEYRCDACRSRMTVLAATINAPPPRCERCGRSEVTRLLSRFAAPRSDAARMEALADPSSLAQVDERDPKSVARWMRRLGRETGEDLDDRFEEEIERAAEDVAGDNDSSAENFPGTDAPGATAP